MSKGISSELIVKFMTAQPFYYGAWCQLRTQWMKDKDFPAYAGVMHSGRGFTLLINEEKWETLDTDSKIFLLAHECAHVVLGHVPPDEATKQLNHTLVNISMDLVINEHFKVYRGTELAKQGMWLDKFPQLPQSIQDLDWRTIYEKLMEGAQQVQGSGQGFDDHESFSKGDGEAGQSNDGKGGEGEQPGAGMSNTDLADLAKAQAEEITRNAARHCKVRGLDSAIPAQIRIALERPKKTHIQMVRELLQRFVMSTRDTKKRMTWRRTSRRLGAVARGKLSARLPRVAVAVDSSGSMVDDATINLMGQAVVAVCAVADRVDVVVGDTEVRAQGTVTAANCMTEFPKLVKGGGGTTLQPLLDRLQADGSYDCVLLITDGACDLLVPGQPTVALIVPGGQDAPGVRSVRLEPAK
jgi:predicted metal-dependent peptidase